MGILVALSNGVSQLDVGEREGKNTCSKRSNPVFWSNKLSGRSSFAPIIRTIFISSFLLIAKKSRRRRNKNLLNSCDWQSKCIEFTSYEEYEARKIEWLILTRYFRQFPMNNNGLIMIWLSSTLFLFSGISGKLQPSLWSTSVPVYLTMQFKLL